MASSPAIEYLEQQLETYMNVGYNRGVLAAIGSVVLNAARVVLGIHTTDAIEALGDEKPLRLIGDYAYEKWPDDWKKALSGPLSTLMQAATEPLAPVFGSFDLANPKIAAQFGQYIDRLTGELSQTTRNNVEMIIREAEEEGLSVPDTARYITSVAPEINNKRATLIARTELTTASNGASLIQAKESGLVAGKRWIATDDDRTRPMHNLMDGDIVPIDKPFRNGLHFPQEPNCRCSLGWVFDEEDVPPYQEPETEAQDEAVTEGPGESLEEYSATADDTFAKTERSVEFLFDRGYTPEYLGSLDPKEFESVLKNEGYAFETTTPEVPGEAESDPGEKYADRREEALRFRDDYEAERWGTQAYEEWREDLPDHYREALNEYSGGAYRLVNKLLRDRAPERHMSSENRDIINFGTKALNQAEVPEDVITYRGTLDPKVYEDYLAGTVIGSVTRDPAFFSTSLDFQRAEDFSTDWDQKMPNIVAEIFLPAGHPGAYLNGLSRHAYERELTLPPGTPLRVIGWYEKRILGETGIVFQMEPA